MNHYTVTFFAAAKKVTKESSYPQPKHFTPAAAQAIDLMEPRVASALKGLTGLGSRTVCQASTQRALVQHQKVPAQRFALPPGMQGKPTVGVANTRAHANLIDRSAAKRAGAFRC